MQKVFYLLMTIFLLSPLYSYSITVQKSRFAKTKVYITEFQSDADLIVYISDFYSPDDETQWKFTSSLGDFKIQLTQFKSSADLVVYITEFSSQAGWKKDSPLKGKLKTR